MKKEIDYEGIKALVQEGYTISQALAKLNINSSRFYRNVPPLILTELRSIKVSRAIKGTRWNKKK